MSHKYELNMHTLSACALIPAWTSDDNIVSLFPYSIEDVVASPPNSG